jgi:hypothetical protein
MSKIRDDVDEPLSAVGQEALRQGLVVEDTTPALDPATFDLEGFALGVRPTRRTVKLYARSDLIGTLDAIADEIESTPEHVDVDYLIAEFDRIRDLIHAETARWTVEKRSSEWVTKRWADYADAHNIRLDKDGDTDNLEHRRALITDQLIGQIVAVKALDGRDLGTPTHEQLSGMFDANELEFNKLIYAMHDANSAMGSSAKVLTRDFSQRSSTARSGQAS